MKNKNSLSRKAHFLGTKIRNLRKRNRLTMEDLSARCIKIAPDYAPSVSYLSMIERGKRVPSEEVLDVIAEVFQKKVAWFLDDIPEQQAITPDKGSSGGINGMALEPNFLFSNEILQIAIPEILSQTGTSGRQFAHLLIRAHQEHHQNHFPDLEKAAEEIGQKRLPISLEELFYITKQHGMQIKWFTRTPKSVRESMRLEAHHVVTSFYEPPNTIYINKLMEHQPIRLKYNLAVHIGHCVLHDKDSMRNVLVTGRDEITPLQERNQPLQNTAMDTQDVLKAWRDFECSFFAGALLCPKVPFRHLLDRRGYEIDTCQLADVSPSVAMRRMTAVSPYPHWHYFDAYAPGKLKAVYRGNGIPLPWGNMRLVDDPCQHWAVFRMINSPVVGTSSQISILNVGDQPRIYACESIKVTDLANHQHVLCSGIDLNPAIEAQGGDAISIADELKLACVNTGGSAPIPRSIKKELLTVAKILNINWVERGIENEARTICSRGAVCPRTPSCYSVCETN